MGFLQNEMSRIKELYSSWYTKRNRGENPRKCQDWSREQQKQYDDICWTKTGKEIGFSGKFERKRHGTEHGELEIWQSFWLEWH